MKFQLLILGYVSSLFHFIFAVALMVHPFLNAGNNQQPLQHNNIYQRIRPCWECIPPKKRKKEKKKKRKINRGQGHCASCLFFLDKPNWGIALCYGAASIVFCNQM